METAVVDVSGYGNFARYYDELSGDAGDNIELIRNAVTTWRPLANSLLELGCGTGSVLTGFADFERVVGIDHSEAMLKIARVKVPFAELILGDMSQFDLGQRFDVVACVFDTLNHLERFSQWQSLIDCVARHLEPGGLLVFDVNTLSRLQSFVHAPPLVLDVDGATIIMNVTEKSAGLTDWEIRIFTAVGDHYELSSEHVSELAAELDLLRTALSAEFEILDEDDGSGARPNDDSSRAHFVARRRRHG